MIVADKESPIDVSRGSIAAVLFRGQGVNDIDFLLRSVDPLQIILALDDVAASRLKVEEIDTEIADFPGRSFVLLLADGEDRPMKRIIAGRVGEYQARGALRVLRMHAEFLLNQWLLAIHLQARQQMQSQIVTPPSGLGRVH